MIHGPLGLTPLSARQPRSQRDASFGLDAFPHGRSRFRIQISTPAIWMKRNGSPDRDGEDRVAR
jgi:hypothetical protein